MPLLNLLRRRQLVENDMGVANSPEDNVFLQLPFASDQVTVYVSADLNNDVVLFNTQEKTSNGF